MHWQARLKEFIAALFKAEQKVKRQPRLIENNFFKQQAREQFVRLNKKGLSIPVMSL